MEKLETTEPKTVGIEVSTKAKLHDQTQTRKACKTTRLAHQPNLRVQQAFISCDPSVSQQEILRNIPLLRAGYQDTLDIPKLTAKSYRVMTSQGNPQTVGGIARRELP